MTKFKADITTPQARFLEWALEQPEKRHIDHTEGWHACAVGDYHREADSGKYLVNWSKYAEHILPRRLHLSLNCNGKWAGRNLNTYGDLQEVIRRHYVEN